jgi:hypothetical protein
MESKPLLNRRRGSVLSSVLCTTVYRKEGTGTHKLLGSAVSKCKGFVVHSMNKTGGGRKKCFLLGTVRQVEWAGIHHLLSPFSSPCFGVTCVYNYGPCWPPTLSIIVSNVYLSIVQVLRVVNEPPSPALSRKSSSSQRRPNQGPPSFLHTDDHGDTFLQVISYSRTTMGTPSSR